VILAGGGLLSICDVLSLTGMNPHHHLEAVETASICVHDCSKHKEPEPVPCPEDCHITIPDAEVTKDTVFVFGVNPILLPWSQDTDARRTCREIFHMVDIRNRSLHPDRTGTQGAESLPTRNTAPTAAPRYVLRSVASELARSGRLFVACLVPVLLVLQFYSRICFVQRLDRIVTSIQHSSR